MTTFTISALDASRPADYLAALGLTHLAQARTLFQEHTPVLTTVAGLEDVVETVAAGLETLTLLDAFPLPDREGFRTTTPTWGELTAPSLASWDDPLLDAVLRTFDLGGVGAAEKAPLPDPKVPSSSLMLISGRSYIRKSLSELWPPPTREKQIPAVRRRQHAERRADLTRLLHGGPPTQLRGSTGLRFTVADPSPRLRSGTEKAVLLPTVEALAFAGAIRLLPRQQGIPTGDPRKEDTGGRRPGLTWALNPVALSAVAMVSIHEQQAAPDDWPWHTAVTRTIGGGTNASHFVDVRPLEAP